MYKPEFSKQAQKDAKTAERAGYRKKIDEIIDTVEEDPFDPSHQFEKIVINSKLTIYTRRINRQHRFVYTMEPNTKGLLDKHGKPYEGIVAVARMWGHCP